MENSLAQKAITYAVKGQWHEAYEANLEILKNNPDNIDALNRLARCYSELGNAKKAKETANKVLTLDPSNQIAHKCILKYKNSKPKDKISGDHVFNEVFLEESGRTKIIELMNLGDKSIISAASTGDLVKLTTHTHKVSVVTSDDKYLGRLPDDLAVRVRNLVKQGNKYTAYIKSSSPTAVVVFIREQFNKTKNPSFPPEKIDYVSYTPPELVYSES